jgi:hypothetical protein
MEKYLLSAGNFDSRFLMKPSLINLATLGKTYMFVLIERIDEKVQLFMHLPFI